MVATRTKIICTMGPAVNSLEKILELLEAGMDVARVNFSHGTYEQHAETIANLKEARRRFDKPMAIMLDTKGPEIRLGRLQNDIIAVERGHQLWLVDEEIEGDHERVPLFPGSILKDIKEGMHVLFNDGYVSSKVLEVSEKGAFVEIENRGELQTGKGVNIPNATLDLPSMTDDDIADIKFGCEHDVDIIAASFIRSPDNVLAIKRLIAKEGKPDILVVAKIENSQGVNNFDAILQVSDGIMIARGDLGVELPLSQVPRLQKMMIRKAYVAGKPSVTATQMLESMIHHSRPTRAEASDIANAIYDSTSAVMLSGETAIGRYPVESVNVMTSIVYEAEKDFQFRDFFLVNSQKVYHDVPSSVTLATVETAYSSNARVIFAFTMSGATARLVSRLRPVMPIIAMTPNEKSYHQMAFNWGVIPVLDKENYSRASEAFDAISEFALRKSFVQYGDLVVVTAGTPFGVSGTTNMMIVENIGDVLVRGEEGYGERVHGKIALLLSPEEKRDYAVKDHILVIPKCDDSYIPFLKQAKGVVLQNQIEDVESEEKVLLVAKTLNLSVLVRADGACNTLQEGQLVTLDPKQALVFKGVIEDRE